MIAIRPPSIQLSGLFNDRNACNYVVLQDDLRCVDRDVSVAYVRVMRQGHPFVHTGTIRIAGGTFRALGTADADRNSAIASALILWLQHQSMRLRFALRTSVVSDDVGRLSIRFEDAVVQSS